MGGPAARAVVPTRGDALDTTRKSLLAATQVHGTVAPGFEQVRDEFERNFALRGEIGAAVAA